MAELLALLYAATLPFDGLAIGDRSLPFLSGVLYLAVAVVTRLVPRRQAGRGRIPAQHILPAMVFTLYCALSYYWSLAPDLTISRITTLVVLLVTSSFLAHDLSRVGRMLPAAFVLGAVPAALLVLVATASTTDRRTANGNANDVALTLLIAVACALWLSLKYKGKIRVLGVTSIGILISGVVATGSRTAIVGGAAMLVAVAIWLVWTRRWRPLVLFFSLSALAGVLLSALPAELIPSRLTTIQDSLGTDSFSGRTYLWEAILVRGFDPFGVGAGATPAYFQDAIGAAQVSHNVYLGVLLETGLFGMFLFLAIILTAFISARRSPYSELLFIALPVMVAGSMTLSLEASRLLWFLIALAWVVAPRNSIDVRSDTRSRTRVPSVGFGVRH